LKAKSVMGGKRGVNSRLKRGKMEGRNRKQRLKKQPRKPKTKMRNKEAY